MVVTDRQVLDKQLQNTIKQFEQVQGVVRPIEKNSAQLGVIYKTRGELDKAEEYYRKALKIDEALDHKEGLAKTYGNLGLIYQTRGELDRACEYWRKSLKLFTDIGAKDSIRQVGAWIAYDCKEDR